MSPPTDSRKRPRLTKQRVLEGAVALADQISMEGFTIRKLATELDTKPLTIYHHVPNKEAIIDGMVDLVSDLVLFEITLFMSITDPDFRDRT